MFIFAIISIFGNTLHLQFLPGYEVNCGIYHNKIMAAVVIKDLTLLIVPHPMVRLWLTLLGFLVTAVIILLAGGLGSPSGTHKFGSDDALVWLFVPLLCSLYKDCVSTQYFYCNISIQQMAAVIWLI